MISVLEMEAMIERRDREEPMISRKGLANFYWEKFVNNSTEVQDWAKDNINRQENKWMARDNINMLLVGYRGVEGVVNKEM
jgi:hypothetical protein